LFLVRCPKDRRAPIGTEFGVIGEDTLAEKKEERARGFGTTLLSELPPTDPAVLKAMDDARLGMRHYAAIGRVASQWSYFEAVIDTWLLAFANINTEIGVCFTSQMMGSRSRMDAFVALVRHLGAKKKWNARLEDFAKNVVRLSERRNRAVHDVWQMHEPSRPMRLEVSAKRTLRIVQMHVPTAELTALAQSITDLQMRFDDMASAIFTEINLLRAFPGTTPPKSAR
jgi:hypothetical protein